MEIQPANKAHVVHHVKAGRLKFSGDPDLEKVRESRSGGSEEYHLRSRDPCERSRQICGRVRVGT